MSTPIARSLRLSRSKHRLLRHQLVDFGRIAAIRPFRRSFLPITSPTRLSPSTSNAQAQIIVTSRQLRRHGHEQSSRRRQFRLLRRLGPLYQEFDQLVEPQVDHDAGSRNAAAGSTTRTAKSTASTRRSRPATEARSSAPTSIDPVAGHTDSTPIAGLERPAIVASILRDFYSARSTCLLQVTAVGPLSWSVRSVEAPLSISSRSSSISNMRSTFRFRQV